MAYFGVRLWKKLRGGLPDGGGGRRDDRGVEAARPTLAGRRRISNEQWRWWAVWTKRVCVGRRGSVAQMSSRRAAEEGGAASGAGHQRWAGAEGEGRR